MYVGSRLTIKLQSQLKIHINARSDLFTFFECFKIFVVFVLIITFLCGFLIKNAFTSNYGIIFLIKLSTSHRRRHVNVNAEYI